jgi:uncharacterized protein YqhQ
MVRIGMSYVIFVVVIAILVQVFTPFPAVTWLGQLIVRLAESAPLLFIIVAATLYGFVKWLRREPRAKIAGSTAINVSPQKG